TVERLGLKVIENMARTLTEGLARERMFVTAVTSGPMFRQDPEVFRALGSGVQRLRVRQPVRGRLDVTQSSPANRPGQAAKRGKTRQASHRWKELHPARGGHRDARGDKRP